MRNMLAVAILALAFAVHAQVAHQTTLTTADTSCTTTQTCTLQVYRAIAACPISGIGTLSYQQIAPAVSGTATASTTTWSYVDRAVFAGTTYCYYVTATYSAGLGGPSLPSNTFQGVIPAPPATPPTAPILSGRIQ